MAVRGRRLVCLFFLGLGQICFYATPRVRGHGFRTRDFMGSQCRSGGLQGRHTCAVPRIREAWFQNTEFRSCAPCAQLAHSMCSCHHAPSPRSHQTNVTSGIIRTQERFYPVLLQPSSLFSAAKAAGFPGGFHRARSAAGWLNREDTGAGNPAAEQRFHIISTQAFRLYNKSWGEEKKGKTKQPRTGKMKVRESQCLRGDCFVQERL